MTTSFAELLRSAVDEPGVISAAYRQFHNYSLGNQLLAWAQCIDRGIQPGPIATFMGWKEKGRHVRKGEKAITLCMPVTVKKASKDDDDESERFTRFVYRPHWFVLAQTEGQPLVQTALPAWNRTRALVALNVMEEPFAMLDGNVQGYPNTRRPARASDFGTNSQSSSPVSAVAPPALADVHVCKKRVCRSR